MHTSSTQGDAREGNLIMKNCFSRGIKTEASTVVGKGKECVPCDPDMSYEREGD